MIKSSEFNWKNDDINEQNFPIIAQKKKEQQVECELYTIDCAMTGDAILKEMDEKGYLACTLPELLAFEKIYRKEWTKNWIIIALGAQWRDLARGVHVPYLGRDIDGRGLGFFWLGGGYNPCCQFLVSRKSLETGSIGTQENRQSDTWSLHYCPSCGHKLPTL